MASGCRWSGMRRADPARIPRPAGRPDAAAGPDRQPRIWRPAGLDFRGDELRQAAALCTPDLLAAIARDGFNGIWLRGRLFQLMASRVLPELNDPARDETIAIARDLVVRLRAAGLGLHLFLNEPQALARDHGFWRRHPDLAGTPHADFEGDEVASLCLSHPVGAAFLDDAAASVLRDLPGLAGVILITASEQHSHCWSHHARCDLGDGIVFAATTPLACPRCREREPAALVAQICGAWRSAAAAHAPSCQVIAWNWSWSFWYADPQAEVIAALPPGVAVMADWERGGTRPWRGRDIAVDEYSLGFAGPSARFTGTRAAALAGGREVLAKLQLGTTHEVATVPNLPLPVQVHAKLVGLHRLGVEGFMGTWNFGCSLTLNTAAVALFFDNPAGNEDGGVFLDRLARSYFGLTGTAAAVAAWQAFGQAIQHYPFHLRMLYFSPVNDAPAHPLSFSYRGEPLGASWVSHGLGDRLEDCCGPFSLDEVAAAFTDLSREWESALASYRLALAEPPAGATPLQRRHRAEESACAEMLGVQWRSAANLFRFHARRAGLMAGTGLVAPCTLPRDPVLLVAFDDELGNAERGLRIAVGDARLGFHQEAMAAMYDAGSIRAKIAAMRRESAS